MPRSYDKTTNKRIEIDPNGNGGGIPPSSPPPPLTYCPMDISILVDLSGSTRGPGTGPSSVYPNLPQLDGNQNWNGHPGLPFESQRKFVENLIDDLTPAMNAGQVQVNLVFWANRPQIAIPYAQDTGQWPPPTGYGSGTSYMHNNQALGNGAFNIGYTFTNDTNILNTNHNFTAPDGNTHSIIGFMMWHAYMNNSVIGGGTKLDRAIGMVNPLWDPGATTGPTVANNIGSNLFSEDSLSQSEFGSQYSWGGNSTNPRELLPNYKRVAVIVTDSAREPWNNGVTHWLPNSGTYPNAYADCVANPYTGQPGVITTWANGTPGGCGYQSSLLSASNGVTNICGPSNMFMIGVVCGDGDFQSKDPGAVTYPQMQNLSINPVGSQQNVKDVLDCITCYNNSGPNGWNTSPSGTAESFGFYIDVSQTNVNHPEHYSNVSNAVIDTACGITVNVPETYECSMAGGTTLPDGTIIPPWTCYDPGNGLGSYSGPQAQSQCLLNCNEPIIRYECSWATGATDSNGTFWPPWTCYEESGGTFTSQTQCSQVCNPAESYNCNLPWVQGQGYSALGTCWDPGDGSGQYSVANGYANPLQACTNACREERIDPGLTGIISGEDPSTTTYGIDPGLTGITIPTSWNCNLNYQSVTHGTGTNLGYVGTCTEITGTSGDYATEQICLNACREEQVITNNTFEDVKTWKCIIPHQQLNGYCVEGHYNPPGESTEADCLDKCQEVGIGISPNFEEYPCKNDIKACPCGWEYDSNAIGGPDIPPGEKWCKNPDFDWFHDPANSTYIGSFGPGPWTLAMPPFTLKCSDLLNHHWKNSYSLNSVYPMGTPAPLNPFVGMPIEGSGTNYDMAGNISWPFYSAPSYNADGLLKWNYNVIVEVNPGSLPNQADPNIQVNAATHWVNGVLTLKNCVPQGGIGWPPLSPPCEETLACPCGWTPVQASWATWGWTCEWTENTPGGPRTIKKDPYKIYCHILGLGVNDPNNTLPSQAGGVPSYCLDQWNLCSGVNGLPIQSTSAVITDAQTGQYFKTITWDKATIFDIKPFAHQGGWAAAPITLQQVYNYVHGIASTTPIGTVPIGCNYVISKNTSASGCGQPC